MEVTFERKIPFCVISKKEFGEHSIRDIQTNTAWHENPYGEEYAVVPENLVEDIIETNGFCDIELNEDSTEVVSFTRREIPETITKNKKPTTEERLKALEMAMLEQIGVVTE
jgi:hypothetical protein